MSKKCLNSFWTVENNDFEPKTAFKFGTNIAVYITTTMKKTKAKREYKDSVFTSLFKDKRRLLELYNAIEGTTYNDPEQIEINTLSSSLFGGIRNDISFRIGNQTIVLIEHQSSLNRNMPL
ncbi:MAG: hypothetical protein LBU89_04105, partial [Fibromonadaceae bacterium]|nr:hypothetical protein [Fibromonadaceae bacterium]